MRKRMYALMLCVLMLCSNAMSVQAAEQGTVPKEKFILESSDSTDISQGEVHKLIAGNALSRGIHKPNSTWDVAESGQYDFTFEIYPNSYCYSGYCFTGVTEAVLHVDAECSVSDNANYGLEIYRDDLFIDNMIGNFDCYTNTDDGLQYRITNMDASKKYYFKIVTVGNSISGDGNWREG
uniref:hypothetical protein n=1 Tax=Acetatifactor sp. TaxID=1872090 RepID=UPI004056BAE8